MDRRELLGSPEEAAALAAEAHQSTIWTALPGIVEAVDLGAQTLSVQPAQMGHITLPDGTESRQPLPLLVDVPICWPRAGGFALTFPIKAGDEVLVVFASRCIDAWWQQGGVQPPAEFRMHDLSDGFAILAPTSQPRKLSGVSSSNVQLRNEGGDTFVEITPDGVVRAKATNKAIIEAPEIDLTAETLLRMVAPQILMAGNIGTTGHAGGAGTISMTGQVSLTGGMTATQDVVASGVSLNSHVHTNAGGNGDSGGPK